LKTIAFMTPSDTRFGFSMAGVSQFVVTQEEAEDTLHKLVAVAEIGLIVVDERLISGIDEDRLRDLEGLWHGIILVLPSPVKPVVESEDYAARLIRRAVGYHVRLNL